MIRRFKRQPARLRVNGKLYTLPLKDRNYNCAPLLPVNYEDHFKFWNNCFASIFSPLLNWFLTCQSKCHLSEIEEMSSWKISQLSFPTIESIVASANKSSSSSKLDPEIVFKFGESQIKDSFAKYGSRRWIFKTGPKWAAAATLKCCRPSVAFALFPRVSVQHTTMPIHQGQECLLPAFGIFK